MLKAYKGQPTIERRFEQIKTVRGMGAAGLSEVLPWAGRDNVRSTQRFDVLHVPPAEIRELLCPVDEL